MNFEGNKIKLSFKRPKFIKNGNKITCILKYKINVPSVFERGYRNGGLLTSNTYHSQFYNVNDTSEHCFTATGVAMCRHGDTFNDNLGRKIAEARAESAAYAFATPLVKKYVQSTAESLLNMSYDFAAKSDNVKRHNKEYVNDLVS